MPLWQDSNELPQATTYSVLERCKILSQIIIKYDQYSVGWIPARSPIGITSIACIAYYVSCENTKHNYGLVDKQIYVLHCTLIWRRSLITDYVVYFHFHFLKESKLESSFIRDVNFKILTILRVAGSSPTRGTALCPSASHINIGLELVQPRKTNPI